MKRPTLTLRLPAEDLAAARAHARRLGVSTNAYFVMLVWFGIRQDAKAMEALSRIGAPKAKPSRRRRVSP